MKSERIPAISPAVLRRLPQLALLATSLLLGCGTGCSGATPARTDDPVVAEGARLYRTYCGLCHGDRGEGYAADHASALANPDFLVSASDEFIRHAIERGRPGTAMAAYAQRYGGPLAASEIDAIVRWLRSKQRGASLAENGYRAEAHGLDIRPVYERECASCHGERGQGVTAESLNNATFLETATDTFLRHAIQKGRRGTAMPAFERRLSAQEIEALVVYIRGFARPAAAERANTAIPSDLPVVIHPEGESPTFTLREGRFVSSAQVARALAEGKRMVIVDARTPSDWALFRIPGAVPVPYYAIDELVERIPDDGTYVIAYCGCPHAASGRVVDALRERGFSNTAVLDEGILVWRDLGHPVVGDAVEE